MLLAATALLYLTGLSRNGWANDFYAAAVQAGTRSWKAFFFGSFDASNFITVDKTPGLAVGDGAVGPVVRAELLEHAGPAGAGGRRAASRVLYAAVRRWYGPGAGLLAGAVLALTPVAALMFRFNNPDALLVLLMTAAAYAMVRAVESGRTRWLVLAGSAARLRLPDQDAAGVPGAARVRAGLPGGRAAAAAHPALAAAGRAWAPSWSWPRAGGWPR